MRCFGISEVNPEIRPLVQEFIHKFWHDETVVVHSTVYKPHELEGLVAFDCTSDRKRIVGLLTYSLKGDGLEIVTLNSLIPGWGLGKALIEEVRRKAAQLGVRRIWLVTNNDNIDALRFFQRRGFEITAVYRDAVNAARKLKPSIPIIGHYGIPMKDELEMELLIKPQ